ncbi:MAG TPA: APC family permease [Phycisphaerales bacterium]|nr:APC family permease [Phycisphaerales bacterium]
MSTSQPGPHDLRAVGARGDEPSLAQRVRRTLFGPPRRLDDAHLFHKVSLVAVLAWVGLGADGLSSSAYGPEEAFRALGEHTYLAVALAGLMAGTVLIISKAYSRIIEKFPHGGGGYVVASKLLGPKVGLVSGCALLVDYVLTVTISIAAAGDAVFSVLPPEWAAWKLPVEVVLLAGLMVLNIRGIRESVLVLAPVFFLFVATHAVVVGYGLLGHIPEVPATAASVADGFRTSFSTMGALPLVLLLFHAFSMGGGTYTGIEAVSNGIPMMRHPQAETAKRTMRYMAISLAVTATGLLVCYLLWRIEPVAGKTMNAVLVERLTGGWAIGDAFTFVTMVSAAALLVVAAQAGFADGPRVLANMALDSWVPRRFASLSDRLTAQNGIVLVGMAALAALLYAKGSVALLVVMYSINVFLTFSLSLLGMTVSTWRERRVPGARRSDLLLFVVGLLLCLTILSVTTIDKFSHSGWVTLVATGCVVLLCVLTKRHYGRVARITDEAFRGLHAPEAGAGGSAPELDPGKPTAVVLVAAYGGLGLHTMLNAFRVFPHSFRNIVFVSVGVIDSGRFKGADSVDALRVETDQSLQRYVSAAHAMGIAATFRSAVGTDPVTEAEQICREVAREFPGAVFFAGHLVFQRETWVQRLLHNHTAYAIQRRLQWAGLNMVILPARVTA